MYTRKLPKPKFRRYDRLTHVKSQGVYVVVSLPNENVLEANREPAYGYLMKDGRICYRNATEMEDGRFVLTPGLQFEPSDEADLLPVVVESPVPGLQEQLDWIISRGYFRQGPFKFAELTGIGYRRFGRPIEQGDYVWVVNAALASRDPRLAAAAAMAGYPVADWMEGKRPVYQGSQAVEADTEAKHE